MPLNLDVDQLRAFVTVARTGSFTRTGELLGRTQSAISLQVKRLETSIGRRLFERKGRRILLSNDGEKLMPEAERILELHDRAVALMSQPAVSGRVALGCTEEFAAVFLADALGSFQRTHPDVHIEIGVEPSSLLKSGFKERRYDVVLAKTTEAETGGVAVWREDLIWVADPEAPPALLRKRPLPLLASPIPCVIRHAMGRALDAHGIDWQVTCTSEVNAGLQAAVAAGLGVTALPRSAVTAGMRALGTNDGLPPLPPCEVRLYERFDDGNDAARCLTDHIRKRLKPVAVYG